MLEEILISGLALYYLVELFLLYPKDSPVGPFKEDGKIVVFQGKDDKGNVVVHQQPFAIFDRIRYYFGVYRRQGSKFYLQGDWRSEVWTCPVCLSMWEAIPFTIYFITNNDPTYFDIFQFHFAIAGISSLLHLMSSE